MRNLIVLLLFLPLLSIGQSEGEIIFKTNCAACHSLGQGDLVGPDLKGLMDRRDENWTRSFILGSQALIAEGDTLALALFQKYNFVPMPDQLLNDDELSAVIEFIKAQSVEESAITEEDASAPTDASKNLISSNSEKDNDYFLTFVKNPLNWLITFVLIVLIVVMYTLLKVITVLANTKFRRKEEDEQQ